MLGDNKKEKNESKPQRKSLNPTTLNPKWRYHQIIHTLIRELNTSEEAVYEMNYISVLNWLSFFYERNKIANAGA